MGNDEYLGLMGERTIAYSGWVSSRPTKKSTALWYVCTLVLFLLSGCVSIEVDEEPVRSSPLRPVWSELEIRRDVRFFNEPNIASRTTGTRSYVLASAYVASRMSATRLQPAVGTEFDKLYPTSVNYPLSLRLSALGRLDTLLFIPGVDVLPDGGTSGGTVTSDRVALRPDTLTTLMGLVAVWPDTEVTPERLARMRQKGAAAVFSVGALRPYRVPEPWEDIIVLQVTERTMGRLLGVGSLTVRRLLRRSSDEIRRLPRAIRLEVEVEARRMVEGINIMGYVPGKVPPRSDELVVVCADLDAIGDMGGARVIDRAHDGAGTAAVLELARQYELFSEFLTIPDRTLLFAVWSGARTGHAGLRDFLDKPVWDSDRIRSLIYVGPDPADTTQLRTLIGQKGWRFHMVMPPDSLAPAPEPIVLPAEPWMEVLRELRPEEVPPDPDLSEFYRRAEGAALGMVDSAHRLILREAIAPSPPVTLIGDTLVVPTGNRP